MKKTRFILSFILLSILPFLLYLRGSLGVDESYFMFIGNSIIYGSIPYKDYIDIKPPGIYYLFALVFSAFGKSFYAARSVTFIFNALSAVIIFLIGRKLWNKETGMLSSILFLIGISIPAYQGYYAMTATFMVFFGLLGVLLFFKSEHWIYLIFCGILIGVSTLFKQSGGLFLATIVVFYLFKLWIPENRTKTYLKNSIKNLFLIICGFSIPIIITAFYFWSIGALNGLVEWSFLFILKGYGSHLPSIRGLEYQFLTYSILWVFSFVSILIIGYRFIKKRARESDIFTMIWLILSIYPLTIRQFGHYYVQILPPACLLASISLLKIYPVLSLKSIKNALSNNDYFKIFVIVSVLLLMLSSIGATSYGEYRLQSSRSIRFDEQLNTAEYIKSHTSPNEKILSFSYEPSIYFLSDRNPPTEYLYLGKPLFDEEYEYHVIDQIRENDVRYITVCNGRVVNGTSTQAQHIYEFILENYEIEKSIGRFDIYRRKE